MGYRAHLLAGGAVGVAAALTLRGLGLSPEGSLYPMLVVAFALLGALLPDLDVTSSKVSRLSGALAVGFAAWALISEGPWRYFALWWVGVVAVGSMLGPLGRHRSAFHWAIPVLLIVPLLFSHWALEGEVSGPLDLSGLHLLLMSPLEEFRAIWASSWPGGPLTPEFCATVGAVLGALSHLSLDLYF